VSKQDGVSHRVTEALIGDASGTVLLTLWDDAIDSVEEGASYKIGNAFTGVFQNTIRLNLGRNGTLEAAATPVENVDESNNMSLKEFKAKSRFGGSDRGDRGGQRGFGGSRDNEYGSAGDY
jgi:replication factor A1